MQNEDTREFASRANEFYRNFLECDNEGSQFIDRSEITIDPNTPSFRIVLTCKNVSIELRYSEHHLDYDQGISVTVSGQSRLQFAKFGINLEHRNNVEIINELLSKIAKLKLQS